MKNSQKGSVGSILLILLAIAIIIVGAYIYVQHTTKDSASKFVLNVLEPIVASTTNDTFGKQGSPIMIYNSGSTNSGGFNLTINSDGSGNISAQRLVNLALIPSMMINFSGNETFVAKTFDYNLLKNTFQSNSGATQNSSCAKSVSFGYTETVTYNGIKSGDLTCSVNTGIQNLNNAVNNIIIQAYCYNSNSSACSALEKGLAQNINSGISGEAELFEMGSDNRIKELTPIYAKLQISKSDGTPIQKIETDQNGKFYVALQPGDYVMTDISAGSSTSPHKFFDVNNWQTIVKIPTRNGGYETGSTLKPMPTSTVGFPDNIEFTVRANSYNGMGLYFDGYSF